MAEYVVGQVGEISSGKPKIIDAGGKEIGVFYEGGAYYGVLNICPHLRAPICQGRVESMLTAPNYGSYKLEQDRKVLRCPWHHWEFELETGKAACGIKQRIKTYAVIVRENTIYLEV
jgi:Ferredoxin subunits of nitrite reductase and ring-hydroxylating dioxygenases